MASNDSRTRTISAALAATVSAAVLGASASVWTTHGTGAVSDHYQIPALVLTDAPSVRRVDATLD